VTGTNGKTTVTMLLASILRAAGRTAGVIGTLSGAHTTPEAPELQARLAAMLADGIDSVAMEVSSHALALHRVGGSRFAAAAFTNLGHDHLDFHKTIARYFDAKASLFVPELTDLAVVNVDDVHGDLLARGAPIPVVPYSMKDVTGLELRAGGSRWTWRGQNWELPLTGRFNVANALAAATMAIELDIDAEAVRAGLASSPPVAGRFEVIDEGQPFLVAVDYAHTPDALTEVLAAAREVATSGSVLLVFGCGGDRYAGKRPEMGAAAASGADVAVITSDNPRSEDPSAIIDAVTSGIHEPTRATVLVEPDRRAAVSLAIDRAQAGDVVVIAGKGHETTQTIGTESRPFDDRAVARSALVARRDREADR
jgi:UDP-N-acetylmuramoyl-L-alanyl-D-glutamate--2,6-diaminopimelate ligase